MSRIPLAWLQLTGQKGRLMVAIAGIAFADLLMLMQVGFESALYDSNTRLHESLDTDLVLVSPQARNLGDMSTIPQRRLHQARSLPKVASVAPFYTKAINWQNPQTRKKAAIFLFGFDLEHPAFALPEVNQNLAALKQPDRLLFDQATRGTYGEVIAQVEAGESVTTEIASRTVHIEGLYSVGGSFAGDGSLMASERTFRRLVPFSRGTVSMGLIKLVPGADAEATAAALKTYLPDDVRVLTKAELVAFEASYWRTNTPIGFIFMVGTAMGFVVGIIIVYQILYSDIADHMAEYATLKAMGYSTLYLLGVVLQEALILAVVGYIPGSLISMALYTLTRSAANLPIYMTLTRIVQVLLITIAMCSISGAVAVRKLSSADPADIF